MEEEDHCDHPDRVRAIAGAAGALAELRQQGWLNIIITNQSGIGRGYFSEADYEAVNAELFRQLGGLIDAAYFCPDHPDRPSHRRKPETGMVEEAVRDHQIDTSKSWFIGDKAIDVLCGKEAGCRTILVLTGYAERAIEADFTVPNVVDAIKIILSQG